MRSHPLTAGFVIVAKLIMTAGLMWFVFAKLDFAAVRERILLINPYWAATAFVVVVGTFVLGAVRTAAILKVFAERIDFASMARITLIGAFFSQALVTFLSGDAMRMWCFSRKGIPLLKCASTVLLDRTLGVIAVALLLFFTLPNMLEVVTDDAMRFGLLALAGACFTAIFLFAALGFIRPSQMPSRPWLETLVTLASISRHAWMAPRAFLLSLAISVAIHIGNTLAIYLLALGFGIEIGFYSCLLVVPTVTLLSMLPISVAGWGVREGAMVIAFGLLGVAPEAAVAVSVLFGLALLAASLPGGLFWLRLPKPPVRAEPGELSP